MQSFLYFKYTTCVLVDNVTRQGTPGQEIVYERRKNRVFNQEKS